MTAPPTALAMVGIVLNTASLPSPLLNLANEYLEPPVSERSLRNRLSRRPHFRPRRIVPIHHPADARSGNGVRHQ